MSLQIDTVKEIEKERNKRYDTSDRGVLSIDLLGGIFPKLRKSPPPKKNFTTVFIFMWLEK